MDKKIEEWIQRKIDINKNIQIESQIYKDRWIERQKNGYKERQTER